MESLLNSWDYEAISNSCTEDSSSAYLGNEEERYDLLNGIGEIDDPQLCRGDPEEMNADAEPVEDHREAEHDADFVQRWKNTGIGYSGFDNHSSHSFRRHPCNI